MHRIALVGAAAVGLVVLLSIQAGAQPAPLVLSCVPVFVALVHLCFDWRVALLALAVTIGSLLVLSITGPAAIAAAAGGGLLLVITLEWRNRQSVLRLLEALAQSRGRGEALWVVDQLGRVIAANDRAWQLGEDRAPVPLTGADMSGGQEAPAPATVCSNRSVALSRRAVPESSNMEERRRQEVDLNAFVPLRDQPQSRTTGDERSPLTMEIDRLHARTSTLERELQETRTDRATLARKMRGKEELLSLVSHDLRSALNAMVGWLYLARSPNASAEGRERALEGIASAVSTQRRLVEQLLDASRLLSGKRLPEFVPVDTGALLRRTHARFETRAHDRSLDLVVDSAATALVFNADPGRVEESLATLVEQAMAITSDRGCIRVSARESDVEGRRSAVIEVEALGARLATEDLDNVLTGAITGRATESGRRSSLGLPMAIARAVTELQGGRVTLQSMPAGSGTRMSLTFPLHTDTAAADAHMASGAGLREPSSHDRAQARARTEEQGQALARPDEHDRQSPEADADAAEMLAGTFILLVDDMDDMLDVSAALLRGYGAHVTTARSAAEAIARYPAWAGGGGERVVISDLSMPGRDGLDLIREIRSLQAERRMPRLPAVAFSAQADLYSRRSVIEAGFDLYLAKPISPQHLVSAISTLIGR